MSFSVRKAYEVQPTGSQKKSSSIYRCHCDFLVDLDLYSTTTNYCKSDNQNSD
jgi:hypothetical protein